MLRLAAPLAVAELGWMAMGIVDTIMAGPLGPAAVGAGILGNMVYYPIVTSGVGPAAGDGHAGLASVRGERPGGLPAHSGERNLARHRAHAAAGLADPGRDSADARRRSDPRSDGAVRAVHEGADLGHSAAAVLQRGPALSAGRRYREAGDVCAGERQPHEFPGQLGADVRALGIPCDGPGRLRLVHDVFARLHGGGDARRGAVARAQERQPALSSFVAARPRPSAAPGVAGLAGRRSDYVRRRGVRCRDGDGGPPRCRLAGSPRHRGAGDCHDVHGAAGNRLGCRGTGGAGGADAGTRRAPRLPDGPRC